MVKHTTPKTPTARSKHVSNVATKVSQRRVNSARIKELLYKIRRAAGLMKSFNRPVLDLGEYTPKKPEIFIGESDNVNSPNHPRFSDLGQLYYKVCVGNLSRSQQNINFA